MKILASSDTHIGRIPSVNYNNLNSSSSFTAVVDTAIKYEVDVLLLAGDVVDNDQYWYEAYGPLTKELDRLKEHDIKLIAVSGNHDSSVFPKLAEEKQQELKVLGLDGKWEAYDYKEVRFIGWSFNSPSYKDDPFEIFDKSLFDNSKPTIGLIHCDVGGLVGSSSYAPLPSSRFESYSDILWITGHIHIPSHNNNHINCGSPYPLDSSEKGKRGVWLLENDNNRWKDISFIPISPYRFESCVISLDNNTDTNNLDEYLIRDLKELALNIEHNFSGTIFCDLIFVGEINSQLNLRKILTKEKLQEFFVPINKEIEIRLLEKFKDNTTVQLDLEQLSKAIGPKATLANILLDLKNNKELLEKVKSISKESFIKGIYSPLAQFEKPLTEEQQVEILKRATYRLLRAMVNQGESNE